jgi:uncharacterized protein (DUF433 family)
MSKGTNRIIDIGRGPQLEGQRLTVMDVFYYLHRGYDFNAIHQAMPSLTREQFDAIVEYVKDHREELIERDQRVEALHERGREAQRAQGGIFAQGEQHSTTEERVSRLREKMKQKLAEKNGAHRPR